MKKLIISLIASTLLIMSGFSQHYVYTGNSFIQYFDNNTLDKSGVFTWTPSFSGPNFIINDTEETLTITNLFKNWQEAKINFDSVNLDMSTEPYVCFEAKVSETLDTNTIGVQLADGSGNFTSSQHIINLTTEWQTFKLQYVPGIWGGTDITDITRVGFSRFKYGDQLSCDLILRGAIAVGDTSYSIITNVEESSAAGEQDITIYPNPVKDEIIVSGIIVEEAIITDLTGNVVMIIEAGNVSSGIDVSGLATGMYIISCKNENGTIQKTFIKE